MKRRGFITLVGGAVAWPFAAWARETGRTYRVGGLSVNSRTAPIIVAMFDELRRLGFVEGQNLTIDWRAYDPRADLVSQFKALCSIQPDVIYTGGPTSIRAAQSATATIPILGLTEDMVGSGLVNSLARPGSNTTGVSMLTAELDGKRLEVLMQAIPSARLIAVLADVSMSSRQHLQALENLAHESEVKLSIHSIAKPEEIVAAIDGAHEGGFIA